jgi:response regulator RpfG family c-di-GMP phosphodiesterase
MTLFLDAGGDPRAVGSVVADVLAVYGAIGDAACGNRPGFASKKATVAVSLARSAGLDAVDIDALYFAGILHAIGAIGNAAYRRGERLSERHARMEAWDVPVQSARLCEELPWIPRPTADIVRWQSECWDGTGYPDQLRWQGIPQNAVFLALADTFVRAADPEEALTAVAMQSGRAFGPDFAPTFTMWYHLTGGEVEALPLPLEALGDVAPSDVEALLDRIADRVDAHIGEAGRWRRIAPLIEGSAARLHLSRQQIRALGIATRLYGSGEIGVDSAEGSFDPLARLAIDERAAHAVAAADFVVENATLGEAAPLLRARAEWFDGTGKPIGLFHDALPSGAAILAAAIAYDALGHKDRIDTAAGTQFDPAVVRAVLEAARALA